MALSELTEDLTAAALQRHPPLFKRLPERLFAPLASANRRVYWALLCALHAKRFGPDAPLPPSAGFLHNDIVKDIEQEITLQDWESEDEEFSPATPLGIRAQMIFRRLSEAGWFRVDRVGVREMITMPPAVAKFLSDLIEFAQTGPEFVAGKIRSIEVNVRLLLEATSEGSSLQEVARQSRSLLEHIRIAGTNVRDLMAEISNEDVAREFVRRFFTDFVEKMFIGDYKELRTREHPLARRQEILRMVEQLQDSPDIRGRLLQWYTAKPAAGDARKAAELFERDIQRLEDLRRIDEYLDRLDDEIRRANRLALAYLDYRLRAAQPLDKLIDHAIDAVLRQAPVGMLPEPFAPGECVDVAGLATPRQATRRAPPSELRVQSMSPQAQARARLSLRAKERRMMSAPKLARLVREQLGDRASMGSDEMRADTVESLRALQVLCTVAMANASGSRELALKARELARGFTARRLEGEQPVAPQPISHAPFQIERFTTRSKG